MSLKDASHAGGPAKKVRALGLRCRLSPRLAPPAQSGQQMRRVRQRTVEPVFGGLLLRYCLRRIGTKGRAAAHKAMLRSAIAYNLKKLLKRQPKRVVSSALRGALQGPGQAVGAFAGFGARQAKGGGQHVESGVPLQVVRNEYKPLFGASQHPLRPPPRRRWRGCCSKKRASASCRQPVTNGPNKAQNASKSRPVNARIGRLSVIAFTSSMPNNAIWEQLFYILNQAHV